MHSCKFNELSFLKTLQSDIANGTKHTFENHNSIPLVSSLTGAQLNLPLQAAPWIKEQVQLVAAELSSLVAESANKKSVTNSALHMQHLIKILFIFQTYVCENTGRDIHHFCSRVLFIFISAKFCCAAKKWLDNSFVHFKKSDPVVCALQRGKDNDIGSAWTRRGLQCKLLVHREDATLHFICQSKGVLLAWLAAYKEKVCAQNSKIGARIAEHGMRLRQGKMVAHTIIRTVLMKHIF